jgi:hypothetical protein
MITPKTRYWMDTEFIENGKTIDLISIGIVCEDGREFYAENMECNLFAASEWVAENVIKHLWSRQQEKAPYNLFIKEGLVGGLMTRQDISTGVNRFCDPETHGKPEFWGYYADYDWVVFCQLFGTMMMLPKGFPMCCNDIKQLAGDIDLNAVPQKNEHHALADAKWNKAAYEYIKRMENLGISR